MSVFHDHFFKTMNKDDRMSRCTRKNTKVSVSISRKRRHEKQLNRTSDPPSMVVQPPFPGGFDHELNQE